MALHYNHCVLVGRLTKDPEFKSVGDSDRSVFSVAVNRRKPKDAEIEETDFIPVVLWGKLAELSTRILKKGSPVLVEGQIRVRQYDVDGETRWRTEVLCKQFQILEKVYIASDEELDEASKSKSKK